MEVQQTFIIDFEKQTRILDPVKIALHKGSILEVGQGSEFAFAQHNKQIPNQRQQ